MYVLRPWRRLSVPRGVPVWTVPWKQEGQDIWVMGDGDKEGREEGRKGWTLDYVEYECRVDGTGRDGNMALGSVRTLILFCPRIVMSWQSRSKSVLHHTIELSESVEFWFPSLGDFLLFGSLLGQRNLSGKKVLQDSSSQ